MPRRFILELALLAGLGLVLTLTFAGLIYPALGWPSVAPMPFRTMLLAIAAWLMIRSAGQSLADFGFHWQGPIWLLIVLVLAFFSLKLLVAQPLADGITDWIALPRGNHGFFDHLRGNIWALAAWLPLAWLAGGVCEEFLFRGYLMTRLADALGGRGGGWTTAVGAQAVLFGGMHFYLGPGGVLSAMISAVFFGAFFLLARRSLWPVILVHGLWDSLALVLIYSTGAPAT